jgi:hypothetical protein
MFLAHGRVFVVVCEYMHEQSIYFAISLDVWSTKTAFRGLFGDPSVTGPA